ncbi:ABC transporter permease [Paeniglutamicibacter antarcticus]|uniref:ABC transporter permease n=1 Tax=Paeniglutamicibacter antarcticus TaxID=494023 RepID=UPI001AE32AEA
MKFILSRNGLRLVIWAAVLALMIPLVYDSQQQIFPTQADRDAYVRVANTPAVAAMTGLPYAAGSLGGILVIKVWMTLAVALGFASIFLVTRNGRADEETGRTELLRSAAVGRHAYSLANYVVAGALSVTAGLLISVLCLGLDLPTNGSWVMGASIAGTGLAFVAVSAICGQLSSTSRGANSLAVGVLGLFYLIRAGADLQAEGTKASALSWFSPFGWAQTMRAFGENSWWPMLAILGLAVLGCALALRIETSRDLGSGILPERGGSSTASGFLANPLGLVLRLQRGSLISWLLGALLIGGFFGAVARAMVFAVDPNNSYAQSLIGAEHGMLNGVLGVLVLFNGLLAGAFAVQSLAGARSEEESGRLENLLAGSLARPVWLGAHVLVAAGGSAAMMLLGGYLTGAASQGAATGGQMAAASFAYWPGVLLMLGVLLFCQGVLPRAATAIAWTMYGISFMAAMFGGLFSFAQDAIKATPFGMIPRIPAEDFTPMPLVVLALSAVVLGSMGFWRFRARDLIPG